MKTFVLAAAFALVSGAAMADAASASDAGGGGGGGSAAYSATEIILAEVVAEAEAAVAASRQCARSLRLPELEAAGQAGLALHVFSCLTCAAEATCALTVCKLRITKVANMRVHAINPTLTGFTDNKIFIVDDCNCPFWEASVTSKLQFTTKIHDRYTID
jgi:hypothetical protein